MLLAVVGIDGNGEKHPLGVIEGATENTAVVQALLDNLVGRGLEAAVCRLFIIDGAKALSKAIRNTFGRHTPIQRCQVHKARNITERLAKPLHASVRKALRQAWELDDADKAERLIAPKRDKSTLGVATVLDRRQRQCPLRPLDLNERTRGRASSANSAYALPHTSSVVSSISSSLRRWSSGVIGLPSATLANPHWGLSARFSTGTY